MLRLGNSLQDVLFNYAWDGIAYTVVSRTMLGALYAGLWPLGLIKLASVLDNPFSVALARADKAGKVLAHALIDGVQGKRPVTLMGYSVGARVIYACLLELAEQHAFGLVESVVLMGAPVPSDINEWTMIRSVVAARVVNVYSTEDYVLGYLYRSTKLEFGVAGLDAVKGVYGIENADMSKLPHRRWFRRCELRQSRGAGTCARGG
jgi:pimeloyl-ACP methyl ester carboxylesterase